MEIPIVEDSVFILRRFPANAFLFVYTSWASTRRVGVVKLQRPKGYDRGPSLAKFIASIESDLEY